MKAILFAILVLFSSIAGAAPLPVCYTGTWYNPATSGSGLFIDANASYSIVAWFTFDSSHRQVWLTAGQNWDSTVVNGVTGYDYDVWQTTTPPRVTTYAGSLRIVASGRNWIDVAWSLPSFCAAVDPLCGGAERLWRLTDPAIPCP